MVKRIALIDGDIFAYRYAFSNQETFDFGDTGTGEFLDKKAALKDVDRDMINVAKAIKATSLLVCLSGATNFRKKLNPNYKANRKGRKEPKLLKAIRHHFLREYPCEMYSNCEADDVLGILHTKPQKEKTTIVSIDKDMRTLPGDLYNPWKELKEHMTKEEADNAFYMQTLMGDPIDGYAGIPHVGPKRATDILSDIRSDKPYDIWLGIVAAYEDRGLTKSDALMNARMARILTWDLWDEKSQEVIYWEPPTKKRKVRRKKKNV